MRTGDYDAVRPFIDRLSNEEWKEAHAIYDRITDELKILANSMRE